MKTRETKKQEKSVVVLSEATDGMNKVRLLAAAAEEEEACPWEEIDAYSGRFVVAGYRYNNDGTDDTDTSNYYHPWLAYSTDGGKTWKASETTTDESQPHGYLRALAYGGGRFVVAGYRYGDATGGTNDIDHPWLAYSTDGGKTWTASTTTEDENQPHGHLYALAYGGGRFVVAGFRYDPSGASDNNHPWLAYSTDGGVTWTASTTTADENQPHGYLRALAYGGGRFVVAGYRRYGTGGDTSDNYHPWLAYSTDGGKTWTASETTADAEQPHGELHALAYGGGRFVVAGQRYGTSDNDTSNYYHPWLAYSTDGGKTWKASETTTDESQPHGYLRALAYGGGRFVVAGYRYNAGFDDSTGSKDDYHPWLAYSTDGGETWTKNETTMAEEQPHGRLYALAYGGGRFVVAGWRYGDTSDTDNQYHPWLAYSTDGGKTWIRNETTTDESQPHGQLWALAYAPDTYCWKFGKENEEEDGDEDEEEGK